MPCCHCYEKVTLRFRRRLRIEYATFVFATLRFTSRHCYGWRIRRAVDIDGYAIAGAED